MPRRPFAVIVALAVVTGLALSACAPAAVTSPPEAEPSGTPAPVPTAEEVAPGERPPAVFGGDCSLAVRASDIAAATGLDDVEVVGREPGWPTVIDNVGGLVCEWTASDVVGRVSILPRRALDGAQLPAFDADYYFVQCGWGCGWLWESDDLWISGYSSDLPDRGRAEADRIGSEIGAKISARASEAGLDWQRSMEGWWPSVECSVVADAVGSELGAAVTAVAAGYHDPPPPETLVADIASRQTWCLLTSNGADFAAAEFLSGTAWSVPWAGAGVPLALGVAGVDVFAMEGAGYLGGQVYEMTDGVNELSVEVGPDSPWSVEELVAVFAEIAASGLG